MVRNLVIGIAAIGLIGSSGMGLAADARVTANTGVGVKAPGVSVTGTANAKARASATSRKRGPSRLETSEPGEPGSGINGRLNTRIPMRPTINDKVHDAPDFRA
jgi:hypothetical protein